MKNKWEVTIISPLHISSGEKYQLGIDSVINNSNLYVIDLDKLTNHVSAKEISREMGKGDFDIRKYLRSKNIRLEDVSLERISIDGRCEGNPEILSFIKNAYLEPYIPGSSIKGAIRTALLCYIIKNEKRVAYIKQKLLEKINEYRQRDLKPKKTKTKIGKVVEETIYAGKERDAKYDLLKAIKLSDSPRIGNESTAIYNIKVHKSNRLKDVKIFAQCVKPQTKTEIWTIKDDYFIQNKDKLGFKYSEYLEKIADACNEFAKRYREHELKFYQDSYSHEVKEFYEKLKIPDGKDEFLIHLGWGSGWLGMTIGLLLKDDKNLLTEILDYYELDKYRLGVDFPKSRKVVCDAEGTPKMPLGWAKVKIVKI